MGHVFGYYVVKLGFSLPNHVLMLYTDMQESPILKYLTGPDIPGNSGIREVDYILQEKTVKKLKVRISAPRLPNTTSRNP